jgi:hypothetical protein
MDQNDILPSKFLLAPIYEYSVANPREYNYIGIGSGPRHINISQFTPNIDQILPKFLINEINDPSKKDRTFRIVHIDTAFGKCISFLHEYFSSRSTELGINFQYDDSEEICIWRSEDHRIEIMFVFTFIYHGNDQKYMTVNNLNDDTWFLEKMVETVLHNKNKLFIQEFSGHSFDNTRQMIYHKYLTSGTKDFFLDNILMHDECHCGSNIANYTPLIKDNGSFYNFQLYNYNEMKCLVGSDPKINDVLKNYFLAEYKNNLSKHHINYTRKFNGHDLMYNNVEYNESSSSDEIMKVLIQKLNDTIEVLNKFGFVTPEKTQKINEFFTNYKNYDVHKWRIDMGKIFD